VLSVGYCRVSTEEQVSEGYSLAAQAERIRAFALARDMHPVEIIEDGGLSGKDLNRPGIQRVMRLIEERAISNVIAWKYDRVTRNLRDLTRLVESCEEAGVGLLSVTEDIDLTSPTGRMHLNILGTFAQFYREQLAENVRMGLEQSVRQGRHVNRPKFGYEFDASGVLSPSADAPTVRRIFRLRAEGLSYPRIEAETGVLYSTVRRIVLSRVYLGEVPFRYALHRG